MTRELDADRAGLVVKVESPRVVAIAGERDEVGAGLSCGVVEARPRGGIAVPLVERLGHAGGGEHFALVEFGAEFRRDAALDPGVSRFREAGGADDHLLDEDLPAR